MGINLLPIEVLFLIFNYLDFKSQMRAKRVCQEWYGMICGMMSRQSIALIHDTNQRRIQDRCGNFNLFNINHYKNKIKMIALKSVKSYKPFKCGEFVPKIVRNLPNVRAIYLCLFNVSDNQINLLHLIASSCDSDLRHLSIICRKSVRLTYEEIALFCHKYPNLKIFQFEALVLSICGEALNFLLESLTKLEVLILMDSIHSYERRVELVYDEEVPIHFKNISKSIKVIKTAGVLMPMPSILDMSCLPSLCNLHICDFDDLQSVHFISEKFPNLLSLTLSCAFTLHYESEADFLMESIERLNKLQKLHLFIETENRIFTNTSFAKLKVLQKLTTIQIESTILHSHCIESICRSVPQLKKLDLTYIEFEDNPDHCISWIKTLKHLECLKLSAITEFSEGSVDDIIRLCTQLEFLDFSRSEQMSVLTIMVCIEAAKTRPHKKLVAYFPHRNKNFSQSPIFAKEGINIPNNLVLKFPNVRFI